MSKIERFEDIQAWQQARELSKEIYRVTNNEPFTKDYSLKDKIRRASTSIMLNIAEGFARRSTNEFKQFLYIAHGSAPEVQSALYITLDQNYISDREFHALYKQTDAISKMMVGFIKNLSFIKKALPKKDNFEVFKSLLKELRKEI
ncbi:four helix bundle protein [ANME-1 cluster archaeon AG-394-G21]|nr:four helix bundle protein [ANME-1 cluster archaeon AG-394-G21]